MKDLEQARNLLDMANKDYQALQGMKGREVFPEEIFGFHVQQAVEKALKAWLCCLGGAFPKIHDLDELSALLRDAGQSLPEKFVPLLAYTDFAVTFRYDAYPDLGHDIDRDDVIKRVGDLLEVVGTIAQKVDTGAEG
jgi:HEPN domain-containing protein